MKKLPKILVIGLAVTVLGCWLPSCTVAPPQPHADGIAQWAEWRSQLEKKLGNPTEVAKWGRTDAERSQIVAQLRTSLRDPQFGTNVAYTEAQMEAIRTSIAAGQAQQPGGPGPSIPPPPDFSGLAAARIKPADIGAHLNNLYNTDPERGETPSQASQKDGSDDITAAIEAGAATAQSSFVSGANGDDPLADQLNANGGPSSSDPSTPPPPGGDTPCSDRQGTLPAPVEGTRAGTIFSPEQDSWMTKGTPVPFGFLGSDVAEPGLLEMRQTVGPIGTMVKQFKVQAHVIDKGGMDPAWLAASLPYAPLDYFRSHLFLMWPGQADPYSADYWGNGSGIDYKILCYADDAGITNKADLTRGYVEAWLPVDYAGFGQALAEPGFQVRAVTTDYYLIPGSLYTFFLGSDMHTVHLGPKALANSATVSGGVGLTLDDSFVEDKNSTSNDDIEATIEPLIETGVSSAVNALDGTSKYLATMMPFEDWGYLGFTLDKVSKPGSVNVEWSTTSTTADGSTDDERLLKAKISLQDIDVDGWASLPVAALGLVPCFFSVQADIEATLTMGLDSDGSGLKPDATFAITSADINHMLVSPIPLGCNLMYLMSLDSVSTLLLKAGDLTPFIADGIDAQLSIAQNIPSLSLPTGGRLYPEVDGYEPTCDPYGCDGAHAGDVALTGDAMEAAVQVGLLSDAGWLNRIFPSIGVTPVGTRFPVSYSPSGVTPVEDSIRAHTTPDGSDFSAAAIVAPELLNQALAALTEGSVTSLLDPSPVGNGLLDISTGSFNAVPQSAPVFLQKSGYDLGLFLPDLEFDLGSSEYYALNLSAGLNVELATDGTLSPTISLTDVAAGLGIFPLRCSSYLWIVCTGVTSLVSSVASTLGTVVLPSLIEEPLALFKIPELAGINFSRGQVDNIGGNLAVYVKAG